jgi:hypothetical protein
MSKRMKYDFERLDKYCKENNVILLDDYSSCKLTKDTYIKSKCAYENCSNDVNKNFRELENAGSYCKTCIKLKSTEVRKKTCLEKYGVENVTKKDDYKSKFISPKYNYDTLKEFCDKNGIELLNDYKNVKLSAHYYVEGKCQNDECENTFNKKMHKLINTTGMCNQCIFEKAKEVRKNTNLKNIGCESYFQNEDIIKMNRIKIKKTMIEKYGVEHPIKNPLIKSKIENTCLKKYGHKYGIYNQEVQNKIRQTTYNKYGVKYASQNKEIKEKIIETSYKNWGVKHPMQNPEIFEKSCKNCYKSKIYKLPSGKILKCQGYEPFALNDLINSCINENDIINERTKVPEIWFFDKNNIEHRYYVDIYIPSQNKCIEVKSIYTYKKEEQNNILKQEAAKKLGYDFEFWIYDRKGNKICYE